jgi:SAM-dependent methyltransferase
MTPSLPDWQLPPGVTRGLWDYLHDPQIAQSYDASLAASSLFTADLRFTERHCARPSKLLDLGCGTGRLLVPFAQRGYWVLGVDLSEPMLRAAGARAAQAGVVIQRLKANLVDLSCLADESFDYAACLFSTLGMIDGSQNRQQVLKHVYRLLRPGGRLVLHVHNRWFNAWDPSGRRWLLQNAWRSLLGLEPAGGRRMPVHQGIVGLTLHLFTRREVVRLLRRVGFRMCALEPVSLRPDGRLPLPYLVPWLRAYGYLLTAAKNAQADSAISAL